MIATNIAEAAVSMAEAQAYARVESGEEEALLAGLVRTASALCESFTGRVLVARPFEEVLPPDGGWQRLGLTPVRAIEEVAVLAADGSSTVLASGEYEMDVDSRMAIAAILNALRTHGLIAGGRCTVQLLPRLGRFVRHFGNRRTICNLAPQPTLS